MDKITHKVRCEQWTSIIKECLASGMPKTTWHFGQSLFLLATNSPRRYSLLSVYWNNSSAPMSSDLLSMQKDTIRA